MNKCIFVGRLCRDPEVRNTQGENSSTIARFSIAVNRRFKNSEGNYDADFINCVAFGKTAEFIENYFKKGMAIGITGRLTTGSYTNKDGIKVYTTDVTVEEAEFVESKNASQQNMGNEQPAPHKPEQTQVEDGFINIPNAIEEELPFN